MRNRGGGNGAYQFGQPGIVHVQPYAWMYMYSVHVRAHNARVRVDFVRRRRVFIWTPIEGEVSVMGEKVLLHIPPGKKENARVHAVGSPHTSFDLDISLKERQQFRSGGSHVIIYVTIFPNSREFGENNGNLMACNLCISLIRETNDELKHA